MSDTADREKIDPEVIYNDAEAAKILRMTVTDLRKLVPYYGSPNKRRYLGAGLTAWIMFQMVPEVMEAQFGQVAPAPGLTTPRATSKRGRSEKRTPLTKAQDVSPRSGMPTPRQPFKDVSPTGRGNEKRTPRPRSQDVSPMEVLGRGASVAEKRKKRQPFKDV